MSTFICVVKNTHENALKIIAVLCAFKSVPDLIYGSTCVMNFHTILLKEYVLYYRQVLTKKFPYKTCK